MLEGSQIVYKLVNRTGKKCDGKVRKESAWFRKPAKGRLASFLWGV